MVDFPLSPPPVSEDPVPRPGRRRFSRAVRAVAAVLAVAVALFALAAVRLSRGLPERWTEKIGEAVSTDDVSIEPSRVSFSLAGLSLRLGSLGVYRRGEVAEPIAKATGVKIVFRPRTFLPSAAWLSAVAVDAFELSLDLEGGEDEEEEEESGPVALPDVPPVLVKIGRADLLGFRGRGVEARLSCAGGVLRVDNARLAFPEEKAALQELRGKLAIAFAPFSISAEGGGRLDPNTVSPVIRLAGEPEVATELERFDFPGEAPEVAVDYAYCPARGERRLRLRLSSGAASYNGVPVESFSGLVEVGAPDRWGYVTISRLDVARPEGAAAGTIEIAPVEDALRFSATATMDPAALAALVGILDADGELPVDFPAPAQIRANGTFSLGAGCTNDLSLEAFAPEFRIAGVPLRRSCASLSLKGDDLRVENVRADVLGGDLSASFGLVLPFSAGAPTNRPAVASVALTGLSYAEIARTANPKSPVDKGTVNASLFLEGPLDDMTGLSFTASTGTVSLAAVDSRVYRIPVFAGLTDILASFVPGVDWLVDEDNFAVRGAFGGGRLRIDPFTIDGTAVSVSGRGNVYFPNLDVDLKVKAHLLNRSTWLGEGVYWLLSPISKIFEIRATGQALSPRWTSATFQSNPSKK